MIIKIFNKKLTLKHSIGTSKPKNPPGGPEGGKKHTGDVLGLEGDELAALFVLDLGLELRAGLVAVVFLLEEEDEDEDKEAFLFFFSFIFLVLGLLLLVFLSELSVFFFLFFILRRKEEETRYLWLSLTSIPSSTALFSAALRYLL